MDLVAIQLNNPDNSFMPTGASLFFISENSKPDPTWEAVHFRTSELQFPFFSMEPSVIILEGDPIFLVTLHTLFQEIVKLKLQSQVIIFNNRINASDLVSLFNIRRPSRILENAHIKDLQLAIQQAFEKARQLKQEKVLYELFQEQNNELKNLSQKLEDRIAKRQSNLEETKEKLFATNKKNSFLQHCLFTVHNCTSITDLEKKTYELLEIPYGLKWFRIYLGGQQSSNLEQQEKYVQLFKFPLTQDSHEYGALIFARDAHHLFRREEKDFLEQMSEAISLCIDRLLQIERNKDLQSQWQSTFNAILDPVGLIGEDYTLHLANQTFTKKSSPTDAPGKKCYEVLFSRTSPCVDCHRGSSFRLRDQSKSAKIYDVFSQTMIIDYQKIYFHLYRDISQQLGFERQLVESAKMAELGTISSSIAHELNNPLGGMLNFIQLIKMDLKKTDQIIPDIQEMELAAIKCKEIVKNLLGFSRTSAEAEVQNLKVEDVLKRALMITELRTRSLGIRIDLQDIPTEMTIEGRFNPLTQVFCNVLQNAYESILEKRKAQPQFAGQIEIKNEIEENMFVIRIIDDGTGLVLKSTEQFFDPLFTTKDPDKHSGLGLTLARQILKEHRGFIELSSQKDGKTCLSISFSRPQMSH